MVATLALDNGVRWGARDEASCSDWKAGRTTKQGASTTLACAIRKLDLLAHVSDHARLAIGQVPAAPMPAYIRRPACGGHGKMLEDIPCALTTAAVQSTHPYMASARLWLASQHLPGKSARRRVATGGKGEHSINGLDDDNLAKGEGGGSSPRQSMPRERVH